MDCVLPCAPRTSDPNAAAGGDWQAVPLQELSRSETEFSLLQTDGEEKAESSRKVEYSMCGLSKLTSWCSSEEANVRKVDCQYIAIQASEDSSGVKEVRLSIHGLEDSMIGSENVMFKTGNMANMDSGPLLETGDDECLPLLQQVWALFRGAKLSCTGLLSGDGKLFSYGWSSALQRSFSYRPSEKPSEGELHCKKSSISGISRATSLPICTSTSCNSAAAEATKAKPLLARDPASRAEALPLAHYRPTDAVVWKEGDAKTGLPTTPTNSPVTVNCKKPPKPPRHPGRSVSIDSATIAAQRSAKKIRDRASAKRKSRGATNAAASTGLTPLVALVLTIGFGVLMVFQGVFVQTNVSYGRNTDSETVNVAANSRFSLPGGKSDVFVDLHSKDPNLPASVNVDFSSSKAVLSDSLVKSMAELPWSRSSLISQAKSMSG